MYIKSLTLRGFLSFKHSTTIPFDPRLNVIVGRNGSGKSTILTGIRVVMGELMPDKGHYLHHGVNQRALVGFITLVLDNSDRSLAAFDDEEVIIRRDFSEKKDEFWLNGKKISRQELLNIFEAAGFSRHNPYYFIHQHEVSSPIRMTPTERLNLIREVAGTVVYDEKRAEAAQKLSETRERLKEMDSALQTIQTRIQELNKEQDDYTMYSALEKKRDFLKYLSAEHQIAKMDDDIEHETLQLSNLSAEMNDVMSKLASTEETVLQLESQLENDRQRLDDIKRGAGDIFEKINHLEAKIAQTEFALTAESQKTKQLEQLHCDLEAEVATTQMSVDSERHQVETLRAQRIALSEQLTALEAEFRGLKLSLGEASVQRQGRVSAATISEYQSVLDSVNSKLAGLEERLKEYRKEETDLKAKLKEQQEAAKAVASEVASQDQLRAKAFKTEMQLRADLEIARAHLIKKQCLLQEMQDQAFRHLRSKQSLTVLTAKEWKIKKPTSVYGTVLDCISAKPEYHTAIEAAAESRLYDVVVKDRATAYELVCQIQKNAMRATYGTLIPIEDLKSRDDLDYPDSAKPLISLIDCLPEVLPAIKQVFGRYLLVSDAQNATSLTPLGFNCVTPDGTVITTKGLVTGGFRKPYSNLRRHHDLRELEQQVDALQREVSTFESQLHDLQAKKLPEKTSTHSIDAQRHAKEILLAEQLYSQTKRKIESLLSHKEELEQAARKMSVLISSSQARADSQPLSGTPVNSDEACTRVQTLRSTMKAKRSELETLQAQLVKQELNLDRVLTPHLTTLITDLQASAQSLRTAKDRVSELERELEFDREQLRHLKSIERDHSAMLDQLQTEIDARDTERETVLQSRVSLSQQKDDLTWRLDAIEASLTKAKLRKAHLSSEQQMVQGMSHLREEYGSLSLVELDREQSRINQSLQSLASVNHHAVAQLSDYTKEEESLSRHREALANSEQAILDLMSSLDIRKEATLTQAIQNLDQQFNLVFEQLVPGGKAKLLLETKMQDANESEYTLTSENALEKFSSSSVRQIIIKVQFPHYKEFVSVESLSGGQKTCVSLSLLFAFQRVESAPFYVLDEIDANLDNHYRENLARLLSTLSAEKQIILISHRPEMIAAGTHFIRTFTENQMTRVNVIPREKALEESERSEDTQVNDENFLLGVELPRPLTSNVSKTTSLN